MKPGTNRLGDARVHQTPLESVAAVAAVGCSAHNTSVPGRLALAAGLQCVPY